MEQRDNIFYLKSYKSFDNHFNKFKYFFKSVC